jgi:hypothetical protein
MGTFVAVVATLHVSTTYLLHFEKQDKHHWHQRFCDVFILLFELYLKF